MATDYDRLMGVQSLNGKVEAFGRDVTRTTVFTRKFRSGRQLATEDGQTMWDEVQYSRGLAPVVGHMGRFPEGGPLTKLVRRSAVAHIKRAKRLDPTRMFYERETGTLRPNAQAYVEGEMRDAVNEITATYEYMAAESMRGTLTVNSTNVPGSTQTFTISYTPNTYTATSSWANPGTLILSSEVPLLKQDIEQTSGLAPAQVIGGATVNGFVVGNTQVTNFAQQQLGEKFITQGAVREGPMLGGLMVGGLSWQITEGGYIPEGGSFTRFLPTTDEAIVLPADSELVDVLGYAEGRGLVPRQQYGPASSAAELIAPAAQVGFYAYATLEGNGPFVLLHIGYVGLPVVLRPQAVCNANLIP
jgi:hypothetical protein